MEIETRMKKKILEEIKIMEYKFCKDQTYGTSIWTINISLPDK